MWSAIERAWSAARRDKRVACSMMASTAKRKPGTDGTPIVEAPLSGLIRTPPQNFLSVFGGVSVPDLVPGVALGAGCVDATLAAIDVAAVTSRAHACTLRAKAADISAARV